VRRDGTKYGNIPTRVNGVFFASKREARRYQELLLLERAGVIRDLETQPVFDLDVNGVRICRYLADFRYYDTERNALVVEDSKGVRTETYKLKARLMKAVHGIEVEEV
jgi:hypothetical protein